MYLYKATAPRKKLLFKPSKFYRTEDFLSSADKPKPGYTEDELLYAGEFHEMAIYLMPNIYRIQTINQKNNYAKLSTLGFKFDLNKEIVIFINDSDHKKTMEFSPTVYVFEKKYFTKVKSGEYVSKEPVEAIRCDTFSMLEALDKWKVELILVPNVHRLRDTLILAEVGFIAQD